MRLASLPLAHARAPPRGAAGDALTEAGNGDRGAGDEGSLLWRQSGFGAELNIPRFNTQVCLRGCLML